MRGAHTYLRKSSQCLEYDSGPMVRPASSSSGIVVVVVVDQQSGGDDVVPGGLGILLLRHRWQLATCFSQTVAVSPPMSSHLVQSENINANALVSN